MEVKAKAKFIRMSPKKVRLVANLVREEEVEKALSLLKFSKKAAAQPLIKLINSAMANAVNNFELEKSNLYIKEIKVDEGSVLKRWLPRAYGRATPIRKRSSHISIILDEVVASGKKEAKKQKIAKPTKMTTKPKEEKGVKIKEESEKKKEKDDLDIKKVNIEEGKKIADVSREGRHGHARIEGGGHKGFVSRIFRRKSG